MKSGRIDRISRPLPHVADAFPRMCGAEGHYRAQIRLVRAAVGEDRQAGYELETI